MASWWIWFTATFCCCPPWKPPISAEIWWHEKTHSFTFHKWTCWQWKCCEQIPLKRSFQLQWGDVLSKFNWIREPFHQILPSTIVWTTVEHLSVSLYSPPGQIAPPLVCTVQKTPRQSGVDWQEGQDVAAACFRGTLASWHPGHW